jgi:hypothetical protein
VNLVAVGIGTTLCSCMCGSVATHCDVDVDTEMPMRTHCPRIDRAIEMTREGARYVVEYRYFRWTSKGPICDFVCFGKIGTLIPTPIGLGYFMARTLSAVMDDARRGAAGDFNRSVRRCCICP